MTPQELKAALHAFDHAVRAQTAIDAFPSGGITTPDMASDELTAWVQRMADNITDAGLTFVDAQQFAGIPYIPAPRHHNARPPGKVRKHEVRKQARWWQSVRKWNIIPLYDSTPDGA